MDIADTIKFRDICQMLEKLKSAANEPAKLKYLRRYYESFLKHREQYRVEKNITLEEENGSSSFYCILRCLIPNADRAREPYGLQITSLGKVYIKVLQLAADSSDAQRLHARSHSTVRGDYADVVYSVLKPRCTTELSNLSLKQVHNMLDIIAADDRRNTEKELTRLFEIASAQEQKWFIRLLLKSMHLRLREHSVLALLHPQAKVIFERCSDLAKVCCLVANNKIPIPDNDTPNDSKEALGDQLDLNDAIKPFQHIRPQLCEIFPGNIEPLMSADVLYMETKMDGERFQLHYANGSFKYISRNGVDYTYAFGDSYSSATGKLTTRLVNLLPIGMQSIILDGEMMVWDTSAARFRVKGEKTDVKHLKPNGTWRPCFVVYDLLYLNGKSLLELPYVQRAHKLREIIKEEPGVLLTMKPKKIGSKEEFRQLFQAALNAHEEGVVLKKQNACYGPGKRSGGGWYKAKADYIHGLTTEFDLLIIGGFYNRQRTYIESFLLGVLKYVSVNDYQVYSVGKVTNIMRQRLVLNDSLRDHWRQFATDPPPLWYQYADTAEGRPDVWIEPTNSTILQIKAADLAPSSNYKLVKSLHFPRVQAWRNDKVWHECMTLNEYLGMCQDKGVRKINKRELRLEDFTTDRKRFKITPAQARKLGALAYENKINPDEVTQTSQLLQGFTICVLSTKLDSNYKIADLKRLVVANGGKTAENPLQSDAKCISIAGDITFRVENLQKTKRYNIVSMTWLLDVCEQQEMQIKPKDMLCMTDELRQQFEEQFDAYGDSYTECIGIEELRTLLADIDVSDAVSSALLLSQQDMSNLESELFKNGSPNYFRNTCAYFYDAATSPASTLASLIYQWHGGRYIGENNSFDKIQYIFIDSAHFDAFKFEMWLATNLKKDANNIKIVNINWILDSDRIQSRLDIDNYLRCNT